MIKRYRCLVRVTPVSYAAMDQHFVSDHDRRVFGSGEDVGTSSRLARRFRFEAELDDGARPRTKAMLQKFLDAKNFDNPKAFLFYVDRVDEAKKDRSQDRKLRGALDLHQREVDRLRRHFGLPPALVPDDDQITNKLFAANGHCPYCGSGDVDAGTPDGDLDVTTEVTCDACGAVWGERYRFVGAWGIESPGKDKDDG
jgi:hypothetical protein